MRLYMMIPTYILLLIGYFCKNMQAATSPSTPIKEISSESSYGLTTSELHLSAQTSKPGPYGKDHVPARGLSKTLVAALSISLVLICIIVVACIYCVRKRSRKGSAEINSDPSGEAELSFKNIKA